VCTLAWQSPKVFATPLGIAASGFALLAMTSEIIIFPVRRVTAAPILRKT
jgi:hypothetical protein